MATFPIVDEASFHNVCGILHDARFDLSTMLFDEVPASWSGVFERECWDDAEGRREEGHSLWMRRWSCPVAECRLELRGTVSCEVVDRSRIGIYTFSDCQSKTPDTVTLHFMEDMWIRLHFAAAPTGSLTDLRTLERRARVWTWSGTPT